MKTRDMTKEDIDRGYALMAVIEVCALAGEEVCEQWDSKGMQLRAWAIPKALEVAMRLAEDQQDAIERAVDWPDEETAEGQPSERLEAVE